MELKKIYDKLNNLYTNHKEKIDYFYEKQKWTYWKDPYGFNWLKNINNSKDIDLLLGNKKVDINDIKEYIINRLDEYDGKLNDMNSIKEELEMLGIETISHSFYDLDGHSSEWNLKKVRSIIENFDENILLDIISSDIISSNMK